MLEVVSGTVCAADKWVPACGRDTHKEEPGYPTSRDMVLSYDHTLAYGRRLKRGAEGTLTRCSHRRLTGDGIRSRSSSRLA